MIDIDGDVEMAIKVVIVGNGAVGKSSMIQRFCRGIFTRNYKKTIGVDFLERCVRVSGEDVRLMLWDTAGQEEFDAITKAYYRGAQACVIVFSTTDRRSFDAVESWKRKVDVECPDIPMVLVQNKIDLLDEALADPQEVNMQSHRMGLRLFRTSVKENLNVEDVFHYLAECYLDRLKESLMQQQERYRALGPRLGDRFGQLSPLSQHGGGVIDLGQHDGPPGHFALHPHPATPSGRGGHPLHIKLSDHASGSSRRHGNGAMVRSHRAHISGDRRPALYEKRRKFSIPTCKF